jgi:hypothetical protein
MAPVICPGITTVDASGVDTDLVGHFYYAENRSVLSDVFHLLRGKTAPADRFGLVKKETAHGIYWQFKP